MRLPRPRFTVKRLMIAIAVIALALGAIAWIAEMRSRSAGYERRAAALWSQTNRMGGGITTPDGRFVDMDDDENHRLQDAWALRMAAKYYRLSHYPWLALEPEQPAPSPLEHPKGALELPPPPTPEKPWSDVTRPPAWTFPWTWRRR